ncbi:MAG TPA: TMEM175 family protein [Holophagaceae bacterium]|nr:TMEM175 family protein [Holophagaceae bacterium]
MHKTRLEAFSDGVLAIIITIMVLELKVPRGSDLGALRPLLPALASYALSFLMLAIYWNNHHHLFQAVQKVNGRILWANMHLLFWLSLVPFVTGWMGENHFAAETVAIYATVLLLAAIAYFILVRALLAHHGADSTLARAMGSDFKGKVSVLIYAAAIAAAWKWPALGITLCFVVSLIWLVPDRRIEDTLSR